jgi:hypothetical protein
VYTERQIPTELYLLERGLLLSVCPVGNYSYTVESYSRRSFSALRGVVIEGGIIYIYPGILTQEKGQLSE